MPARLKFSPIIILVVLLVCLGCRTWSSQKLQDAAEIGDLNQIKLLLQNGANIDSIDNRGRTALYVAAIEGRSNIVSYLLDQGADPNKGASWKSNQRPLHVAAEYGHVNVIRDLLRHGAKIDERTTMGETVLQYAAWYGRSAAVKLLLEQGANPNARDQYGYSALHFRYTPQDVNVLNQATGGPFESNFKEVAILLVSAGTDVNAPAKNPNGYTPLMAASAVAPVEVVDYLLLKGANIDAKTDAGAMASTIAQARKRNDVLELLKKAKEKKQTIAQ
jgi:ankyrin repeat protein